ncbi:MAG: AN1-type zinc finger domain-containing protein [Methanobacteriota archaeon]
MVECEICGTSVSGGSAFTCTYCGKMFCPAHRLPFNHACKRIEDWKNAKSTPKKHHHDKTSSRGILEENREIIAGGVIVLFTLIMALWFFQII